MAGIRQRGPLYARPFQFIIGVALFLFSLLQGLNWTWDWALQTGNIFLQISVPTQLVVFSLVHIVYLFVAASAFLFLLLFGFQRHATVVRKVREGRRRLMDARFRFYPLTFLFGLFLSYFGTVFLFKASIAGDQTPAGFVIFVYLNYAGIVSRGFITLFAALLLFAGLGCAFVFSIAPGVGIPAPPRSTPAPAAPEPPIEARGTPTRPTPPAFARKRAVAAPTRAAPTRPAPLSAEKGSRSPAP